MCPTGIGQTEDVAPPAPAEAQPETVTEPAEASAETASESDIAPADPSAEAPAESPETTGTTAAASTEAPAPAEAPAVARDFSTIRTHLVVVKDGIDEAARKAPGFSISGQGHILTDSGALRSRDTYLVTIAGGQVFTASAVKTDDESGLMLLQITEQGHGLTALTFARTALAAAAPLYAVKFTPGETESLTSIAGTVTQLPSDSDESPLIVHNALFNVAGAGTPLLNRCWEAVGVNVLQRKGFQQKRIDPMEQGSARSLPASWLSDFLASANISLPLAESECLSLEDETRLRLEQAQQEKEAALQAQREEAETRARIVTEAVQRMEEDLNSEKEAVQQQLEQTRQETEQVLQTEREAAEVERARLEEEAQQRLEQAQQAKEQAVQAQRQEAEFARQAARQATHRGKQVLLYSLVVILVLVLAFLLVMRTRRKRLQGVEQEKQQIAQALGQAQVDLSDASEREQLRAGAPGVLIEGITAKKERITLKIPGASLVEQTGVVVGRSPAESAFIINHEQVSRRHFRLLLVSGQVMIEDLGSTNGTSVNGIPLNPGDRQALGDGSRLQTGNLALTVRIGP